MMHISNAKSCIRRSSCKCFSIFLGFIITTFEDMEGEDKENYASLATFSKTEQFLKAVFKCNIQQIRDKEKRITQ